MTSQFLASIRLTTFHSQVYEPAEDSFLLADTVLADLESNRPHGCTLCVEVGCGSGYVVCSVARALEGKCHCIAIDINPHACQATLKTAMAHAVDTQMDVLRSDLVNGLLPQMAGKVDLLLFNPPYVVTPDEEVERKDIATAWAGGTDGRRVIDRFLPMIPALLSNGGVAFMVVIPENKPQDLLSILASHGIQGKIIAEKSADEEKLLILKLCKNC